MTSVENYGNFLLWATIVLLGLGTFVIRFFFLGIVNDKKKRPRLRAVLHYIPVVAFSALIFPKIFIANENERQWLKSVVFGESTQFQLLQDICFVVLQSLFREEVFASLVAAAIYFLTKSVSMTILGGFFVFWLLERNGLLA